MPLLFGQKPVIHSVTNAATLAPPNVTGHALAPGAIGTIFGENLAPLTAASEGYPLPTRMMGGVSVKVGGVLAPLFYVSPTQINFQTPSSTDQGSFQAYGQVPVTVTTAAGASDSFTADTFADSPGIFTLNGSGCGQAAVLNVKSDGTLSLNSPSNSASPGDFIAIYGTGAGAVHNSPPDGTPAPPDPLARAMFGLGAIFDDEMMGATFAGRAPGLAGVDQINVLIPADVRQGCSVPVSIESHLKSQPALVSIHGGGGPCVDPPVGSAGEIVLKKSIVLNDSTIPEADTFTASFSASPGKRLNLPPVLRVGDSTNQTFREAPPCPIPGYSTLAAGTLSLNGPGNFTTNIQPSTSAGNVSYQASLPSGIVQPASFQLTGTGSPDVGPFQTVLNVGSPIQISSQFPRGTVLASIGKPITVTWTGGQPGQTVTLKIREHLFHADYVVSTQAPATDGSISLQGILLPNGLQHLSLYSSSDVELDIEVGPDVANPAIISAPGLTLGALVSWKYEYRFVGLAAS